MLSMGQFFGSRLEHRGSWVQIPCVARIFSEFLLVFTSEIFLNIKLIHLEILSDIQLTHPVSHAEFNNTWRGSDGKGEWSEMVQECIEEGWWTCFEKSIGVGNEGQEEARTTKEDVEDASREGEQDCWFEEGGCLELSEMKSGSWRDCC